MKAIDFKNVEHVLESQRVFFNTSATKDVGFRVRQLVKLWEVIRANEAEIFEAVRKDLGRGAVECFSWEVGIILSEIDFMVRNIRKLSKKMRVKTPRLFYGASSRVIPEPLGTVLIFGPWNYPFNLTLVPLAGAMAAGNCTVIKPSELAPASAEVLCRLIRDHFPEEYIAVVQGDAEVSTELLKHKFDYIFFTGGPEAGKLVMEAAAKHLTPVTLELGGKSPCIVDAEAKLKTAARRIAFGKFVNAGQTCVAPDYLLVDKSIKDELVQNLIEVIMEFYGSNPCESGCYSRIVNEKHFKRLSSMLADGNIIFGGDTNREKRYIAPTILDSVSPESRIMREEIFGPLLPVIEFSDFDEALQIVNSKPKPLALYIFSSNRTNIEKAIRNTSSGGVCVNDTIIQTQPHLPFGGVGESGFGKYHGKTSFDTFSHKKSVLKNQTLFDIKSKYPPYNMPMAVLRMAYKYLMR